MASRGRRMCRLAAKKAIRLLEPTVADLKKELTALTAPKDEMDAF